jgi:protein-tyrosine phosphatase
LLLGTVAPTNCTMNTVLFLCTGNYYRSRFAEHFFNWLAGQKGLPWRADSRGLAVGRCGNIGPISRYTVEALRQYGISVDGEQRNPRKLTLADLANSDLVIAVKEAEHREMMREQFPLFVDQVEYWHVDDLDCAGPEETLSALAENVRMLMAGLSGQESAAA